MKLISRKIIIAIYSYFIRNRFWFFNLFLTLVLPWTATAQTRDYFFSGPVYTVFEHKKNNAVWYNCEGWAYLELVFKKDGTVGAIYHRSTEVDFTGIPPHSCRIGKDWKSDDFQAAGTHANGSFQVRIFSYLDISGTYDEYSVSGSGYGVDVDESFGEVITLTERIENFTFGTSYRIEPFEAQLSAGESINFVVKKADGSMVGSHEITWSVIRQESVSPFIDGRNAKIGSIDAGGNFTGKGIGRCAVVAILDNGARIEAEVSVGCPEGSGNIQEVMKLFRQRIPEGPFHRDLQAGNLSRPFSLMNPGYANNLYANINAEYANYTCGAYQGNVLRFLHSVQADPSECRLLNGVEFGPIQGAYGGHHAVVVYPAGSNWKTHGLVLDPWYRQKPETFSIDIWQQKFSPISGDTSKAYRLAYPTTQDPGDYNTAIWDVSEALITDLLQVTGIVNCPVNLLFTDSQGRKSGIDEGGRWHFEIPDTFFMRIPDDAGGYEWYFRLNDNVVAYEMDIIGNGTGKFSLVTAGADSRNAYVYAPQSIGPGTTARTTISGINPGPVVVLPDDSQVSPEIRKLPDPCWLVDNNLDIFVPRASFAGHNFTFRLEYSHDLFWELDASSFGETGSGAGLFINDDLSLPFSCAQFGGERYGFTLRYEQGLLWKLDLDSFSVK